MQYFSYFPFLHPNPYYRILTFIIYQSISTISISYDVYERTWMDMKYSIWKQQDTHLGFWRIASWSGIVISTTCLEKSPFSSSSQFSCSALGAEPMSNPSNLLLPRDIGSFLPLEFRKAASETKIKVSVVISNLFLGSSRHNKHS